MEDRVVPATFAVNVFDDGVPVSGTLYPNWGGNPGSLAFLSNSAHFNSTIVMGTTNSPGTPGGASLQLNPQSQVDITASGTHTLRIELTSTDYSLPVGSPIVLTSSAGGEYTGSGSVVATYQTYFDPANAPFGQPSGSATPVQTASAAGGTSPLVYDPATSGRFFIRPNSLFSMTAVAVFTVNGGGGAVNMAGSTVAGVAAVDIEKYVKGVEQGSAGGEGLTPGFWKNHSVYGPAAPEAWTPTGYSPDDSYNAIFGVSVPGNPTLLQALNTGGGKLNALLRHSTAALLNAAHPDIDYAYTVAQVIQMTHDAIVSGDDATIEATKDLFAKENEKGAILGDGPLFFTPTTGYGFDADTPPGPSFAIGSQVLFTYVVTNPGTSPLSNVTVTDNRLANVTPVLTPNTTFNIGDDNLNGLLDPGEVWIYTATEIVTAGQHTNTGTVVATPVLLDSNGQVVPTNGSDTPVTDHDDANYNGGSTTTPVSKIDLTKYVKAPSASDTGGQGLTPGYWKQPQHFGDWVGYAQTDSYNAIFGLGQNGIPADPDSPTLLGALQRGGGGYKALGRHAVAALLNAASPMVNYAYTTAQIISMVQNAYLTGDFETAKNLLATENEKGLTGGSTGTVTTGYGVDANTPPGPLVLPGTVLTFTLTLQNPGQTPLKNPTITDDHGTPAPVLVGGYNTGDDNQNGLLDPGELWVYTYTLAANTLGQNTNTATATAAPANVNGTPLGTPNVTDTDVANWYVSNPTVVTAGTVTTSGKAVTVPLTNKGVSTVTLTKIVLTWPSADGKLTTITLGGKNIYNTSTAWTSGGATITSFKGTTADRSVAAGKSKDLVFQFANTVLTGPYSFKLSFSDGSTLTVNKAATLLADASGFSDVGSADGVLGRVNAGVYLVYVDGLQGDAAPQAEARILDAIDGLNATLGSYGVTVAEVGQASADSANVHLSLADTSVLGGVAEGVLGVTESGGQVTLINGWNWYFGSDPAGVGTGQYDFQTVVTHELGHTLGLGHSAETSSVMYPYLATGAARRGLTANDISVLEADSGPEALLASGFVAPGERAAVSQSAPAVAVTVSPPAQAGPDGFTSGVRPVARQAADFAPTFGDIPTLAAARGIVVGAAVQVGHSQAPADWAVGSLLPVGPANASVEPVNRGGLSPAGPTARADATFSAVADWGASLSKEDVRAGEAGSPMQARQASRGSRSGQDSAALNALFQSGLSGGGGSNLFGVDTLDGVARALDAADPGSSADEGAPLGVFAAGLPLAVALSGASWKAQDLEDQDPARENRPGLPR